MTKKIAFTAARQPQAQEALKRLKEKYAHVPASKADVIVTLGGDGFMLDAIKKNQQGWHFYAALMDENETIIHWMDYPLERCGGDVELSLTQLNNEQRYSVKASIYWMEDDAAKNFSEASDGTSIIVWYEGGSEKPFLPGKGRQKVELSKVLNRD